MICSPPFVPYRTLLLYDCRSLIAYNYMCICWLHYGEDMSRARKKNNGECPSVQLLHLFLLVLAADPR